MRPPGALGSAIPVAEHQSKERSPSQRSRSLLLMDAAVSQPRKARDLAVTFQPKGN